LAQCAMGDGVTHYGCRQQRPPRRLRGRRPGGRPRWWANRGGVAVGPGPRWSAEGSEFVGHEIVRRPKELLGRVVPQAGDTAHIQVGVALDLRAETRKLSSLFEDGAPVRMVCSVNRALQVRVAPVDLTNALAYFIER